MCNRLQIIETLLLSPQGGPELPDIWLNRMNKKWFTYLCCIKRFNLVMPKDIINYLFSFCLPEPKNFINHVPLQKLRLYGKCMTIPYKKQIAAALARRHMNQHKHVLGTKVRYKKTCWTPMQMAERRGHMAAAMLLNPKVVGTYKNMIVARYALLLK